MQRDTIMLPTASERENPDNYPSLSHYLEKTGKIKLIPKVKMLKARRHFVSEGLSEDEVAEKVGVGLNVVLQWVTMFDWEEKRQLILFRQFQKLEDLKKEKSTNMDYRHDRIASALEATVERMIHQHHDPDDDFTLAPKDLTALATTLKAMQHVRRTVHDKPTSKTEKDTTLLIDSGPGLDNMVKMITSLTGQAPQLAPPPTRQIKVIDDNDRDYEL